MVMAGVVMAVAVVWLVVSASERRLDRMGATEQQKVLAAFDQMVAAAEKLNADELFGHVVDNDQGAVASDGQLLLTRADALERTRANFRGLAALKYRITERRITWLGADAAVLVVSGSGEVGRRDGRTVTTPFVQTVVLVERGGAWRVIHSHQSSPVPR